ncbi:hypothetical protein [Lachnospira sp.]|jgi:hypothetical protein|uniref:hypothetical protein n=1 Tax=Lachnospira sp. TaxID=2049031 RepID=UPI00257D7C03|nr:hypothetical protein [Lachnospira sp.]
MANFRTIEIEAFSAQEAMINGPFAAYAIGANCTQAWKKAGCPKEPELLNEFMEEQLEKKTKFGTGIGLYIVLENGYKNKSTRPYRYTNKRVDSYQKWTKSYLLVDDSNKIIREVKSNRRTDAIKAAREEYANGFQGNLKIKMVKTANDDVVGNFEYKPSKGTQLGKYLLFGTVGSLE